MGRRKKNPGQVPVLFDPAGTRRDPRSDCELCGGHGWTLDAHGEPVEPAVRCECTTREVLS
jgi:hypothetical protein